MRERLVLASLLPLLTMCARPVALPAPTGAARCTIPGVGTPDAPWRMVRARGFSYCVPPSWRPDGRGRAGLDANAWSGDAGSIRSGARARGGPIISADIVTSTPVHVGDVVQAPPGCSAPTDFSYVASGIRITVSQVHCQGTYFTSARTPQFVLEVAGETRSGAGADVQLAIFQTIRIVPPTP